MFDNIISQLKNVKWNVVLEDMKKLPEDIRLEIRKIFLWILEEPKK